MKSVLGLEVLPQDLNWVPAVDLRPDRLRKWVEKLPRLNFAETSASLAKVLLDINRTSLSPAQRFEVLNLLAGEVNTNIEVFLRQKASLPLNQAKRDVHVQAQNLLQSIAFGYKAVVAEMIRGDMHESSAGDRLRDAMLSAVGYLAQRILLSYSVYEHAPPGCWGELHRLYQFAEKQGVAGVRVEHLADQSIRDAYLRVVTLALSNPFHLMQGEAVEVYGFLRKWALAACLLHPEELASEQRAGLMAGDFFVDLASEDAPQCLLGSGAQAPVEPRVIQVAELVRVVSDRVRKLTGKQRLDITERLHRDLLRRLRNAWGNRQSRSGERPPREGVAVAAVGLGASHHFISGEVEFQPEETEIRLHGSRFQRRQELSLVPMGEEGWKTAETEAKLAKGVLKPRSYGFDVDLKEDDIWKKAHSTSVAGKTGLEQTVEERMLKTLVTLDYRDGGVGGAGLEYTGGRDIRLRVGELIALRQDSGGWQLGALRWLFSGGAGAGIHMGVSVIEGEGRAMAVRGLQGEGTDCHYLRALMFGDDPASLIVPTGRFDTGSRVLLNDGAHLRVAELQRLLQTSKTFSQFQIHIDEPDEEEQERIVQSLYRVLK